MPKLNQIIAVANGKKTQCQKLVTEVYHRLQKDVLLKGIARSYKPKDEDGDRLPSESKQVQYRVGDALKDAAAAFTELFDTLAVQEYANCGAKADVVVDGATLLKDVPVTYLLFLEKQLIDIHTMIEKLPTLDPGEEWVFSDAQNCWATKPAETTRTKKVPKNHVLAEATDKHPAQVQVFTEDVLVGYWTTINYSGAVPEREKRDILERVKKVQEALKYAREQANSIEAPSQKVGEPVFTYLFGKE
jgi:hypothetical protein